MTTHIRTYITIGLLVLISTVLWSIAMLPAHFAVQHMLPNVHFATVTGTVWKGSMTAPRFQSFAADTFEWSAYFGNLTKGAFGYNFTGTYDTLEGHGIVTIDRKRAVSIESAVVHGSIDTFSRYMRTQLMTPSGTFGITIENAHIDANGVLTDVTGTARITDLTLNNAITFGDFVADIQKRDDTLRITLHPDADAVVSVEGIITIHQNGQYAVKVYIRTTERTSAATASLIHFLPQDNNKRYTLSLTGTLPVPIPYITHTQ